MAGGEPPSNGVGGHGPPPVGSGVRVLAASSSPPPEDLHAAAPCSLTPPRPHAEPEAAAAAAPPFPRYRFDFGGEEEQQGGAADIVERRSAVTLEVATSNPAAVVHDQAGAAGTPTSTSSSSASPAPPVLTANTFFHEHLRKNRPCVLTDLVPTWKMFKECRAVVEQGDEVDRVYQTFGGAGDCTLEEKEAHDAERTNGSAAALDWFLDRYGTVPLREPYYCSSGAGGDEYGQRPQENESQGETETTVAGFFRAPKLKQGEIDRPFRRWRREKRAPADGPPLYLKDWHAQLQGVVVLGEDYWLPEYLSPGMFDWLNYSCSLRDKAARYAVVGEADEPEDASSASQSSGGSCSRNSCVGGLCPGTALLEGAARSPRQKHLRAGNPIQTPPRSAGTTSSEQGGATLRQSPVTDSGPSSHNRRSQENEKEDSSSYCSRRARSFFAPPSPDSSELDKEDYRFVYVGEAGTFTDLHFDVLASYSWSANIFGVKEWVFFRPELLSVLQGQDWWFEEDPQQARVGGSHEASEGGTSGEAGGSGSRREGRNTFPSMAGEEQEQDPDQGEKKLLTFAQVEPHLLYVETEAELLEKTRECLEFLQEKVMGRVKGKITSWSCDGDLPVLPSAPHHHKQKRRWIPCVRLRQSAGELVFVPSGWVHCVRNVTFAISINHNWLNACSLRYLIPFLCDEATQALQQLQGYSESWQRFDDAKQGRVKNKVLLVSNEDTIKNAEAKAPRGSSRTKRSLDGSSSAGERENKNASSSSHQQRYTDLLQRLSTSCPTSGSLAEQQYLFSRAVNRFLVYGSRVQNSIPPRELHCSYFW